MSTSVVGEFETYIRTELGLSSETIAAYLRDVEDFLNFTEGQKLTAQLAEAFVSKLRSRGLKSTTIRRKSMSVRCLFNHLVSLGRLDHNTLDQIDSVKLERKTHVALDQKDVDTLISTLEQRLHILRATNVRRDVAIVLIIYHSGLRVSELCGINLSDINLVHRTILVRGKGNRDRMVPITHRCKEAIQTYIDSDRQSDINALFVKNNGQRIARRGVSDMLMHLSRRAGIKHTTAHTLRRSCATALMDRGVELEVIQSLLGHQHLSTTQAYLTISDDRLKTIHGRCHPFGEKHEVLRQEISK